MNLLNEIECLRKRLNRMIHHHQRIGKFDIEILELSQQLDNLIVEFMKEAVGESKEEINYG